MYTVYFPVKDKILFVYHAAICTCTYHICYDVMVGTNTVMQENVCLVVFSCMQT